MATMTVKYQFSKSYRDRILVETGESLPAKQELALDLSALSREQRAVLVAASDGALELDITDLTASPTGWNSAQQQYYDGAPDLAAILQAARTKTERRAAYQEAEKAKVDAQLAERKRQEERRAQERELHAQLSALLEATPPTPAAVEAAFDEWMQGPGKILSGPHFGAGHRQIFQRAMSAAREADKLRWCQEHGSDHLRTAVAAGYDCQRLYVTERAAMEHPEYTVDFDNNAGWKDRSCPSEAALAEALRVGGEVVWLTEPVTPELGDDEPWSYLESFEPCEAVVIREYLGRYDLIRII